MRSGLFRCALILAAVFQAQCHPHWNPFHVAQPPRRALSEFTSDSWASPPMPVFMSIEGGDDAAMPKPVVTTDVSLMPVGGFLLFKFNNTVPQSQLVLRKGTTYDFKHPKAGADISFTAQTSSKVPFTEGLTIRDGHTILDVTDSTPGSLEYFCSTCSPGSVMRGRVAVR